MKISKNYNLIIGGGILLTIFLMMLVSLVYLPHSTTDMNLSEKLHKPSIKYLFGTDKFGRDIFSRVLKGSQTTFLVGFITVTIGSVLGITLGSISGYFGGLLDEITMRVMDALMAFPGILFALMFISIFGTGIRNTMIAIGILSIPRFARIARSSFLKEKQLEYVKSAKIRGSSNFRIIFIHILPNILAPIIVVGTMTFSTAILAEAALSYLGLGVQPPNPSWGRMLSESQLYFNQNPWYTLAPGGFITLTVFSLNAIGDYLRKLQD